MFALVRRPASTSPSSLLTPDRRCRLVMPAWLPWLLLAAIPVLALIIRLLAGDDMPDNSITHESGDEDDPGPAIVAAAA